MQGGRSTPLGRIAASLPDTMETDYLACWLMTESEEGSGMAAVATTATIVPLHHHPSMRQHLTTTTTTITTTTITTTTTHHHNPPPLPPPQPTTTTTTTTTTTSPPTPPPTPTSVDHLFKASLPRDLSHVADFWQPADTHFLAGTYMTRVIEQRQAAERVRFACLKAAAAADMDPDALAQCDLSPEAWGWAQAIVRSRGFHGPDDDETSKIMVRNQFAYPRWYLVLSFCPRITNYPPSSLAFTLL